MFQVERFFGAPDKPCGGSADANPKLLPNDI